MTWLVRGDEFFHAGADGRLRPAFASAKLAARLPGLVEELDDTEIADVLELTVAEVLELRQRLGLRREGEP